MSLSKPKQLFPAELLKNVCLTMKQLFHYKTSTRYCNKKNKEVSFDNQDQSFVPGVAKKNVLKDLFNSSNGNLRDSSAQIEIFKRYPF